MSNTTIHRDTFGPYAYTVVHIKRRGTRIEWEKYPPIGTLVREKFAGKLLKVIEQQPCGMLGAVSITGFEECGFPHDYEYVQESAP